MYISVMIKYIIKNTVAQYFRAPIIRYRKIRALSVDVADVDTMIATTVCLVMRHVHGGTMVQYDVHVKKICKHFDLQTLTLIRFSESPTWLSSVDDHDSY